MNLEQSTPRKPLRLWPGVLLVVLQWLLWLVVPLVALDAMLYSVFGAAACGVAILVWWLFFSRAPWSERIGALILMVAGVFAASRIVDPSIANGMMGMMLPMYAIPALCLALVAAAVASRRMASGPRRASMAVAILLACGAFALLRTGGIRGDGGSDLHWRWTQTPEERLMARAADERLDSARGGLAAAPDAPQPTASIEKSIPANAGSVPTEPGPGPVPAAGTLTNRVPAPAGEEGAEHVPDPGVKTGFDWPGFRGHERDGVVHGVRIETDWSRKPPVALWRRAIGPGWSSFAVQGNLFYTQEQRGDDEVVSSYNLTTGEPVWRHRDAARFWESNGGAGPRGTPAISNGRVFTFGATGILNALDAGSGAVLWSRNAASDAGAEDPGWGFASSPLVVNDLVIVAASGRLVAYDVATGHQRWLGPEGGAGYSSPQLVTIDGVAQVLLARGARTTSVSPADGSQLWQHAWQPGASIVQPALAADGDLLIATGDAMGGVGMRRIGLVHGPAGWTVEERWTSRALKPYFNDFVVHNGHAFGFDGSILACIDLKDGSRSWKGGRYGNGQLVLLADQDLLVVLTEDGELALVSATADKFTELARFPAIDGKTWNHPVLVGDVLLVRNGEEMAAFRLSLAGR